MAERVIVIIGAWCILYVCWINILLIYLRVIVLNFWYIQEVPYFYDHIYGMKTLHFHPEHWIKCYNDTKELYLMIGFFRGQ